MLEHVIEAEILNFIFGGVNLIVRVFEIRFDNKCGWITGLGSRSMVTTRVATLRENVRDVAVLLDVSYVKVVYEREVKLIRTSVMTSLMKSVKPASTKSVITPTLSGSPASMVFWT